MTAADDRALVRALLGPYPRAFAWVDGERVAVRGVERTQCPPSPPVTPVPRGPGLSGGFRSAARDGLVYLLRYDAFPRRA